MWNFENKAVGAMFYSRFLASYLHVLTSQKKVFYPQEFKEWLEWTGELTNEQVREMYEMATNGRLEAQISVERFLDSKK